ncbi:hypothetical protein [Burkholderia cenocepacia]|uniref:hypothetical protein n=2 Tax=Burkholderia cenocepacia TaxID=95486 RepID=UPI003132A768
MGTILASVSGEIHQREREIARHVDPAQRVVEFDAVEHQDPIPPAHDVLEMQVAVTRAHETARMPIGEQRCDAGQFGFVPYAQRGFVRHRDVERVEQGPALGRNACRAAGMAARRPARRVQMMAGQRIGEGVRIRQTVVVRCAANRQHRPRIEPAHAHHVLARHRLLPVPAPAGRHRFSERASPAVRDERPDTQIQRAGERPIERAFRERAAAPLCRPREIDEGEVHRLDALVRIAPGQVNDGQMGFDPLDPARGVRIGGGSTHCAIEVRPLSSCISATQRERNMRRSGHDERIGYTGCVFGLPHTAGWIRNEHACSRLPDVAWSGWQVGNCRLDEHHCNRPRRFPT